MYTEIFWIVIFIVFCIVCMISVKDLQDRVSKLEDIVHLMEKQKNDYFKGFSDEEQQNPKG